MESPRAVYGLPARPSDGPLRRPGDTRFLSSVPRSMIRLPTKEPNNSKHAKEVSSQSRQPSRVPLPSSMRNASNSRAAVNPVADRQSKSWGSTTSYSSYSRSHIKTESGSSSSSKSYDSNLRPAQPVLRRKKSSLSFDTNGSHNDSPNLNSSSSNHQSRSLADSALGIQYNREISASPSDLHVDDSMDPQHPAGQSPMIYPELDRYKHYERPQNTLHRQYADVPFRLATHDLPPSTPGSLFFSANSSQISAISASPSTKFSESPGPGPYSRDTTPTSIASQSPGLIAPSRVFPLIKTHQQSPSLTRPPVTRRRTGSISNEVDSISVDPHGLAAVRESLTSSSSNSTVKDNDRKLKKGNKTAKAMQPPPPSPPPRKSSQKFSKQKGDETSPSKQKRLPEQQIPLDASPISPNVQSRSHQAPSPKVTRPSRPSRDGTPDLKSQLFSPVPIIQSNLVPRPGPTERRGSESSLPIPRSKLAPQTGKSASTSHLPITDGARLSDEVAESKSLGVKSGRPPATPSPRAGTSSTSRFPFFGRRKNIEPKTELEQREKKNVIRKGPAAGTGHEGYGRIGAVRRRSGSIANSGRDYADSKVSQESLISHDSFLAERVNPVIIAGGGVIENRNASSDLSRTESSQNLTSAERPRADSKAGSVMSLASMNDSSTTLWPSAIPRGPIPVSGSPHLIETEETKNPAMKSTLALRRSIQRLKSSPENPLQLPRPIITTSIASSPMTSFDTSIMSDESSLFELGPQLSLESNNPPPTVNKLRKKKTRSPRKWNFFSRSQNQPKSDKKSEKVTVTVQAVEKKPLAFYAIMDSPEKEMAEPMDIKEVLRHADVYSNANSKFSSPELWGSEWQAPNLSQSHLKSSSSPRPSFSSQRQNEVIPEPFSQQYDNMVPPSVTMRSGRPSRLPQVGRIPQVVSHRPENASPFSFSRPFDSSLQPPSHMPSFFGYDSGSNMPGASITSSPIPDLGQDGSTTDCATEFSFCSESAAHVSPEAPAVKEFLAFSPRKNSGSTTGTSSSESGGFNYAEATAVIPQPDDPPAEDEVWDEYNDLLGDENVKARQSATSSKGIPFHLESYHTRLTKEKPMESPTIVTDSRKLSTLSEAPTTSTTFSADMTERIQKAFQPHPSPTTPLPVPVPVPEEVEESNQIVRKPSIPEARDSTTFSRKERDSSSSTSSEEWSPLAQVNLRVGSMTVSKWLTFGHVLFSDVRHELVRDADSLKRPSILVVDGLGNDDWSFYAAETYPAANFFNLSPRAPLPTDVQNSPTGYPLSPPNHHQIQYLSHLEKFPFAPQSFTCVVYRFPVAAPETHYRNIISEARRVLKPDGFIELSILDVDLNNMGNRGRRTVRQLKERNHETMPETNLASTADLMVRLLGRGGFSGIKAAHVGVPVASSIARPKSDLQDQGSVDKKTKVKDQPSLAEMMRDQSPTADEGITSMVARVGRWWYSRCYETSIGSLSNKSIWNNKALLRECEELGTSLKFMVCCARAPERINSV